MSGERAPSLAASRSRPRRGRTGRRGPPGRHARRSDSRSPLTFHAREGGHADCLAPPPGRGRRTSRARCLAWWSRGPGGLEARWRPDLDDPHLLAAVLAAREALLARPAGRLRRDPVAVQPGSGRPPWVSRTRSFTGSPSPRHHGRTSSRATSRRAADGLQSLSARTSRSPKRASPTRASAMRARLASFCAASVAAGRESPQRWRPWTQVASSHAVARCARRCTSSPTSPPRAQLPSLPPARARPRPNGPRTLLSVVAGRLGSSGPRRRGVRGTIAI